MSELADRLRRERLRRGLRQSDVAAYFGVSQPTYNRWEMGVNLPARERLKQCAEFLGLGLGEVVEFEFGGPSPTSLAELLERTAALERALVSMQERVRAMERSRT